MFLSPAFFIWAKEKNIPDFHYGVLLMKVVQVFGYLDFGR